MATTNVIDVSKFQNTINWAAVTGIDGAIIRAGYRGYGAAGTLATDPTYHANMRGAIAAGIPVGVYWLSQAITPDEAKEEAAYLRNLLTPYKLTYPVYLDSEWGDAKGNGRADKISKAQRTECALAFLAAIKSYGYKPGLYTANAWYSTNWIDGPKLAATGCSIWIARYGPQKPTVPGVDAWQYTDKGTVSGVSTRVDKSYFYTDYSSGGKTKTANEITVDNLVDDGVISSPDYWVDVLNGKAVANAANIKALMDKAHARIAD